MAVGLGKFSILFAEFPLSHIFCALSRRLPNCAILKAYVSKGFTRPSSSRAGLTHSVSACVPGRVTYQGSCVQVAENGTDGTAGRPGHMVKIGFQQRRRNGARLLRRALNPPYGEGRKATPMIATTPRARPPPAASIEVQGLKTGVRNLRVSIIF